jgi:3-hydroxyacyl-[acyl-carrier-protein] dehydratase
MFNHQDIKDVLPYDYPFLLIDTVESMGLNSIIAKKNLSQDQLFFKGHFKDFPIMPGVLILEAIGQAGSFYIRKKSKNPNKIDVLAYSIKNASFFKPAFPGDILTINVKLTQQKEKKNVWQALGLVTNQKEEEICKGEFYLFETSKEGFRKKCLSKE